MCGRDRAGFTVVELMVVVLIIGVLVAVAVPVFRTTSVTAESKACSANLRTLDGAVSQWAALDESRSVAALDTMAGAKAAVGGYVTDFDKTVECPASGTITVLNGNFTCSISAHNYE